PWSDRAMGGVGHLVGPRRAHPALPDGRHDVRNRRSYRHRPGARPWPAVDGPVALAGPGLAARRRRPVRLPRALLRRPATRPASRSELGQLPLATPDRAAVS